MQNSKVEEYIGIDIETALVYDDTIKPDYTWEGKILPFNDNEFEAIIMTEVMEHVQEPKNVLTEANRVLKNGGHLFFTVPFLWPLHEVPHDEFRYTPFSMERFFQDAGFTNIQIHATGGWHASLAQFLGLWVRRSNLSSMKRFIFSHLLKPIIKVLIRLDKKPIAFSEGQMITGLYGTVQKKN
jgi:SAM-dependent methyltransferase